MPRPDPFATSIIEDWIRDHYQLVAMLRTEDRTHVRWSVMHLDGHDELLIASIDAINSGEALRELRARTGPP